MYRWWKLVSPGWFNQNGEAVRSRCGNALAIIERPPRPRLLLEAIAPTRIGAKRLLTEFGGSTERLRRNWLAHFSRQQKSSPIKIGTRLIIAHDRTSLAKESRHHILIIPAAGAFGTGEHATTALCLRMLERISRHRQASWSLFDAGTGSGILALAGKRLGACNVLAIDDDPRAIAVAKSNANLNRIDGVRFKIADARRLNTKEKFQVITANLFSELLIAAIPKWKPRLESGGFLILSGILRMQEKEMIRALSENRFSAVEIRRRGKWIAILASRQKAG
jgi:ribosomal protein L11 methyltransferase